MIRPSEALVGTHLNSIWIEGTVLADPVDLPEAQEPGACRFRVTAGWPQEPEPPSVFLVEARGGSMDGVPNRLIRGHRVRIIGRLHQHRWTDPEGRPHREVKIVGERVETLVPG